MLGAERMSDDTNIEEEAGPKKTFWEHLGDLRTALLRSSVVVGIMLIACLLLGDRLIAVLEYPVRKIDLFQTPKPTVAFRIGTAELGPFNLTPEQLATLPPDGGPQYVFEMGIGQVGEEQVPTLKLLPPDPNATSLRIRLLNLSPVEAFFVVFRVAIYGAIILSSPAWLYFLGQFFLPALHMTERRALFTWMGWGTVLFFMGVAMTYFGLLPIALRASVEYSNLLGFEAHDWRANEYINFVTKFMLGMGIGFQFPIVVLLLVKMGFLTYRDLMRYRRHVIVFCLIAGALLTTPEVITQVAMAVPLYILYEISIIIAWYWDRKKRREEGAS